MMAVYVDQSVYKYRRMVMCHMLADTLEELHQMADKIGVDRRWFQQDASTPHYDICKSKRVLAVKHGAIEVSRKELVAVIRRLREATQHNKIIMMKSRQCGTAFLQSQLAKLIEQEGG